MSAKRARLESAASLSATSQSTPKEAMVFRQRPVTMRVVRHLSFGELVRLCSLNVYWKSRCKTDKDVFKQWIKTHQPIMNVAGIAMDPDLRELHVLFRESPHEITIGTLRMLLRIMSTHFENDRQAYIDYLIELLKSILYGVQSSGKRFHKWAREGKQFSENRVDPLLIALIDEGLRVDKDVFLEEMKHNEIFIMAMISGFKPTYPSIELVNAFVRAGFGPLTLMSVMTTTPEGNVISLWDGFAKTVTALSVTVASGSKDAFRIFLDKLIDDYDEELRGQHANLKHLLRRSLLQQIRDAHQFSKEEEDDDYEERYYVSDALENSQVASMIRVSRLNDMLKSHNLKPATFT